LYKLWLQFFLGYFKFQSGYKKFYLNSPKAYSRKIINAQTGYPQTRSRISVCSAVPFRWLLPHGVGGAVIPRVDPVEHVTELSRFRTEYRVAAGDLYVRETVGLGLARLQGVEPIAGVSLVVHTLVEESVIIYIDFIEGAFCQPEETLLTKAYAGINCVFWGLTKMHCHLQWGHYIFYYTKQKANCFQIVFNNDCFLKARNCKQSSTYTDHALCAHQYSIRGWYCTCEGEIAIGMRQ